MISEPTVQEDNVILAKENELLRDHIVELEADLELWQDRCHNKVTKSPKCAPTIMRGKNYGG